MREILFFVFVLFIFSCSSEKLFMGNTNDKKSEKNSLENAPVREEYISSSSRQSYVINEIAASNSFITDSSVKSCKYISMKENAFAFYRATAFLYYKDINSGNISIPASWKNNTKINIWSQGDFHSQNVGFFQNSNSDIKFDLNDFDESYIAPYYYDLIRYCTSILLLSKHLKFSLSSAEEDDLCKYFVEEYEKAVNLNSYELTKSNLSGFLSDISSKIKSDNSISSFLEKWTNVTGGKRIFDKTNPDFISISTSEMTLIDNGIANYLATTDGYKKYGKDFYKVKDKIKRINSGLGSLGLRKYYVLIEGKTTSNDDDLILELKEQINPAMFNSSYVNKGVYNTYLSNNGKRVFTATKALLKNVDLHTGYFISGSNYFTIKNLSPYKYSMDPNDFSKKDDLKNFIKHSAIALGFAHKRSDNGYNASYIPYVFKDKDNEDWQVGNILVFSLEYSAEYNSYNVAYNSKITQVNKL